jgi:hypothetical protein
MTDALNGQRRSARAGFKMVYAGVLVFLTPGILLWVLLDGLSTLSPGPSPGNGWLVVLVAAASVLSVVAFMRIRKAATGLFRSSCTTSGVNFFCRALS